MSELNAYLDGELCGTFMEKNGQITFAYSPGYESAVPLSLSMPERNRTHKNKVALPFLKGLLPDNAQALENMARAAGYQQDPFLVYLSATGKTLQVLFSFYRRVRAAATHRELTFLSNPC